MFTTRRARSSDVGRMRDLFVQVYGQGYPFKGFYDTEWLTKLVHDDGTIVYVGELDGEVVMTVSVNLSVGGMEDMVGEGGRLVAAPDARVRGQDFALRLCRELYAETADRVQFLFAEARTPHRASQRILEEMGWTTAGFEPMKYFDGSRRASTMLSIRLQGMAAELRRNHPRVIPEIALLAKTVLSGVGLPEDVVVVDEESGYPTDATLQLERLSANGFAPLLRIERGRVKNREVFGGRISLSHGFFQISNSRTEYLVARERGAVVGAVGFVNDPIDSKVRVFELVEFDDAVKGFLLAAVDRLAREEFGAAYVEVDVSAFSPRIQRTLQRLGFVPVAYCPSMAFDNVERIDLVRMAKLACPYDPTGMRLTDSCQAVREIVERSMEHRVLGAEIEQATRDAALFRALPEGDRHHLAGICRIADYPAGTRLAQQGASGGDEIFILVSGAAEAVRDGMTAAALSPGATFGEMALLGRSRRLVDLVVTRDSRVVTLNVDELGRLMSARPRLGYSVMRELAAGLGEKLGQLSGETVRTFVHPGA